MGPGDTVSMALTIAFPAMLTRGAVVTCLTGRPSTHRSQTALASVRSSPEQVKALGSRSPVGENLCHQMEELARGPAVPDTAPLHKIYPDDALDHMINYIASMLPAEMM